MAALLSDKTRGRATMTPEFLKQICVEKRGFETPALNDNLYFHFRGFPKIENLEPYTEAKALWLESNGLQRIEGLDALTKLRCLYLQQNMLTCLENIHCLVNLRVLDISQNRLTKLEGIGALPCLQTLNASKNFLGDGDSVQELPACAALATLDLSNNALEGEPVLDAIASAPKLVSFNLTGNPIMTTPQLRKKMICRMPQLAYLDRPIFEAERVTAEAWGRGGHEAEVAARAAFQEAQKQKARDETRVFAEWKAAKIEERMRALQAANGSEVPGPALEGAARRTEGVSPTSEGVDVTKMAYTPETVDYDDMEVKLEDRDAPPPLACGDAESSVPLAQEPQLAASQPPPVPLSSASARPPPTPPAHVPGTDFDELD